MNNFSAPTAMPKEPEINQYPLKGILGRACTFNGPKLPGRFGFGLLACCVCNPQFPVRGIGWWLDGWIRRSVPSIPRIYATLNPEGVGLIWHNANFNPEGVAGFHRQVKAYEPHPPIGGWRAKFIQNDQPLKGLRLMLRQQGSIPLKGGLSPCLNSIVARQLSPFRGW